MSLPLFRREVLERSAGRACGSVLLLRSTASRVLSLCYAAIAVGLLAVLVFGQYTRSVTISGLLRPESGVTRVVSGTAGTVTAWHAAEGEVIRNGQPLLTLRGLRAGRTGENSDVADSRWLQRQLQSWEEEVQRLEAQLRQRRRRANERVLELRLQEPVLQAQLAAQSRRCELARLEWQRYRELLSQGYVAAAQVQEREAGWLDQQQRSVDLERNAASLSAQLRDALAELADLEARGQRELAGVRRNAVSVRQQLEESQGRGEWQVLASTTGIIDALTVQPGQAVAAGQSLALLRSAAAPLIAELYAPTHAAGLLRTGQAVSLRYRAFPYQKFGQQEGRIVSVSGQALQPGELDASFAAIAERGVEPLYRVRVALARQSLVIGATRLPLRPGSLVEASVRLDTRPIYQWLLSPLAGWRARW